MTRTGKTTLRYVFGAGAVLVTLGSSTIAAADERYSAIVMDARTGEVLQQDAADEERFPASLTKMMTLYMLFEALDRGDLSLDTRLTASRHAASMPPSRLGLRRGDSITVEQAIRAMVVQSANDVAVMVGERLGGSESRFASMMTARAREMGLTDTHFENASGLPDPQQHTTARDMALLGQHLWRDFPARYAYFQTPSNSWRRTHGLNHNHLLGRVDGVDGIKTGYTRASGFNLVSSAERNGRRVIVVVMGGESASARDAQVAYLIDGAFEQFAQRELPGGATFASLPVNRLDAQIAPNGQVQTATTFAPGAAPQGVVVQTLSTAHGPLGPLPPRAQGDANSTDEDDSAATQQPVTGAH
ncbi:MAG TPA: D-alanyl-D-alanine carboxypeptidase family protein [Caulobacterales bacterium]|nr:D-alanyl-D-alanine carboxypeptidase family protein [Caulobacterales bacterium]